jgi:hypothetical protein
MHISEVELKLFKDFRWIQKNLHVTYLVIMKSFTSDLAIMKSTCKIISFISN